MKDFSLQQFTYDPKSLPVISKTQLQMWLLGNQMTTKMTKIYFK